MALYSDNALERPGFRAGTVSMKTTKEHEIVIPERTRGESALLPDRPDFVQVPLKARTAPDFKRLQQLNIETEGMKVQFGPSTLSKLFEIEVRDEDNPDVMVKKNISIAQILTDQKMQLSALRTLNRALQDESNRNSIESRQTMTMIAMIAMKALDDLVTKGQLATFGQLNLIIESLNKVDISDDPTDSGLPPHRYYVYDDIKGVKTGAFLAFMMHQKNIKDPNLSSQFPVYGISGKPVTFTTMIDTMRKGAILDMKYRTLYKKGNEPGPFASQSKQRILYEVEDFAEKSDRYKPEWELDEGMEKKFPEGVTSFLTDRPRREFTRGGPSDTQFFSRFIRPTIKPEVTDSGEVFAVVPTHQGEETYKFRDLEEFQAFSDWYLQQGKEQLEDPERFEVE